MHSVVLHLIGQKHPAAFLYYTHNYKKIIVCNLASYDNTYKLILIPWSLKL